VIIKQLSKLKNLAFKSMLDLTSIFTSFQVV
jgi:hypothetical protein